MAAKSCRHFYGNDFFTAYFSTSNILHWRAWTQSIDPSERPRVSALRGIFNVAGFPRHASSTL